MREVTTQGSSKVRSHCRARHQRWKQCISLLWTWPRHARVSYAVRVYLDITFKLRRNVHYIGSRLRMWSYSYRGHIKWAEVDLVFKSVNTSTIVMVPLCELYAHHGSANAWSVLNRITQSVIQCQCQCHPPATAEPHLVIVDIRNLQQQSPTVY